MQDVYPLDVDAPLLRLLVGALTIHFRAGLAENTTYLGHFTFLS